MTDRREPLIERLRAELRRAETRALVLKSELVRTRRERDWLMRRRNGMDKLTEMARGR